MVQSRMPYQCMAKLGDILVAARGSSIDSLKLSDGSLISTWTCPSTQVISNGKSHASEPKSEPTPVPQNTESSSVDTTLDAPPPAKKRRISKVESDETVPKDEEEKPVKGVKIKQNNRSDAVASGLEAPAVTTLAVTGDGKYVVAVTGEDKSIRVFENMHENGQHFLQQLSQRPMPKRPCALTITPDSTNIISADKFGDVYSLPLIHSSDALPSSLKPSPEPTVVTEAQLFIPAANEFTIHSERNRKALENQRRQVKQKPEKAEASFEHKLLLGHVSMLTDVILASVQGRNYILTADRDEHIRVSRGIPQTHIIEGFCLGHTDFISRLCIPATQPEILISGGGDDELFVWEWLAGRLVSKANLAMHIKETLTGAVGVVKPAISSIQHTTLSSSNGGIVVVASEGVPALFIFTLTVGPTPLLQYAQTILLPGNALSVVLRGSAEDGILVSIDTIYRSGSPNEPIEKYARREERERRDEDDIIDSVLLFTFDGHKFVAGEPFVKASGLVDVETEKGAVGRLGNLLYNLENLRKREGDAEE